ncbi:MAG: TetR/AcrR family transcriptional regulator [Actinobacteria bacterium]|nr:TetR/AcrR family transcriptional regulator [Actinomycetota bacterium]
MSAAGGPEPLATAAKAGAREQKKHTTRNSLVQAAATLFAQRGFSASSVDEIAAIAGLTKGAVYSNFEGKADLALAVLEDRLDRPLRKIATTGQEAEPSQRNRAASEMLLSHVQAQAPWFALELELTAIAARDPVLAAKLRARDEAICAWVASILSEVVGSSSKVPLDWLAKAFIAVGNGVALDRLKGSHWASRELLTAMFDAVLSWATGA